VSVPFNDEEYYTHEHQNEQTVKKPKQNQSIMEDVTATVHHTSPQKFDDEIENFNEETEEEENECNKTQP
jgi:hypothetical protein